MSDTTIPVAPAAPPVLLTAEEFAARFAHVHAELVKGVVKEYPVPMPKHGFVCFRIALLVGTHVEQTDLGRVMSNDSWIRTGYNPDTVRGADVCFFSYERLPRGEMPDGLLAVVPELVIEVRSPSDRSPEILVKVDEYLQAGVRVVVVVDPATSSATVYRQGELQHTFHNGDPLTLPDVLPGFSVSVSRLFA